MLDLEEIARHVKDDDAFHVPGFLWDWLPEFIRGAHPHRGSIPLPPINLFGYEFQLTRFMVLEVMAAVLMVFIFVPLACRIATGGRPRGRLWNLFEFILVFIRDEVARPAIGRQEAGRFLPFLWNVFFFILFCNLLGLVPWAGSPTGALAVTGALALISFVMVVGSGMAKFGIVGYWTGMVPHLEPRALAIVLKPMLTAIEFGGTCIKHCVLAVRLLANMFAGHLVLAVIIGFIAVEPVTEHAALWMGVTIASVFGAAALSLLELFVAFLQAYVFTFLSAVFIGMAVHQH